LTNALQIRAPASAADQELGTRGAVPARTRYACTFLASFTLVPSLSPAATSHFAPQALRDIPRPGHADSANGFSRQKAIAQVLPRYMIEHDDMVARQRRRKEAAALAIARSVKRQREQTAASKTRN